MKLSERLFESTKPFWDKAAQNPFVIAMADGTLGKENFKAYMLQDYYYLNDYISILEHMESKAEKAETRAFLKDAIQAIRYEMENLHIANMKQLGITDEDIRTVGKNAACSEYLEFLRSNALEGTVRGLTALLQCSWSYAYIAKSVADQYGDKIASSPYADWFGSYTSEEYVGANQAWIDLLDSETQDISDDDIELSCRIFEKCAGFEDRFWKALL
ncbi:MAG: hypothetical protein IJM87_02945 [Ruminococcus sp.]|nr:hypothetical protein [Ruminococcus sp.]